MVEVGSERNWKSKLQKLEEAEILQALADENEEPDNTVETDDEDTQKEIERNAKANSVSLEGDPLEPEFVVLAELKEVFAPDRPTLFRVTRNVSHFWFVFKSYIET